MTGNKRCAQRLMSGIQYIFIIVLLLSALSDALQVYIKMDGEFVPLPSNYKIVKMDEHEYNPSKRIKVLYFVT